MEKMVEEWLEVWPDVQKDHGTEYFIPWMTIAFWMSGVGEYKHQQGRMIAARLAQIAPPEYKEWVRQQNLPNAFWHHYLPKTCAVLQAGKWNGLFANGHCLASEWLGGPKEGEEPMLFEISVTCDLMVLNSELWIHDFEGGHFVYTKIKPRHRPRYTRETASLAPADGSADGVSDSTAEGFTATAPDSGGNPVHPA